MLAEQGDETTIRIPNDVLNRRCGYLGDCLLLLDIVQHHRRRRAEYQTGCTTIENVIGLDGWLDRLNNRV